jgi:hypothetical protein
VINAIGGDAGIVAEGLAAHVAGCEMRRGHKSEGLELVEGCPVCEPALPKARSAWHVSCLGLLSRHHYLHS